MWIKFCILIFISSFYLNLSAQCNDDNIIPNQYVVKLQDNRFETFNSKLKQSFFEEFSNDVTVIHSQEHSQALVFSKSAKMQVPSTLILLKNKKITLESLKKDPRVEDVSPDCMLQLTRIPNDQMYSQLVAMPVIQAEDGWNDEIGSDEIIVSISDTGIDYNHPDLKENMWINEAEKNGKRGIDDDNNGCIDDIYGCDLGNRDGDPIPGPGGFSGTAMHGTHVAGTVGAVGNNGIGVTGVAWNVKLMAAKGFKDTGEGPFSSLLQSVYYSADNGARVVNCSWGGQGQVSSVMRDAFNYAISKGTLPVVAAGNDTMNASNFVPAAIPQVLTVGSSNSLDELSVFSNFGNIIDVVAPGGDRKMGNKGISEGIVSTVPGGGYSKSIGTSMAAPHVAGLAALILSKNSNLTVQELMDIIIESGDRINITAADRNGSKYTYPRINVKNALDRTTASENLPDPIDTPENEETCSGTGGPSTCSVGNSGLPLDQALSEAFGSMGGCGVNSSSSSNAALPFGILLLTPILVVIYNRKK